MVEDIHCLHRRRTLLLVTKDQVDPFMQMGADIVTLQSLKKTHTDPKDYEPVSGDGLQLFSNINAKSGIRRTVLKICG